MVKSSLQTRAKKATTIEKLYELFGVHKQIILANFTNVSSNQIQVIRKTLREYNGLLLISKNTLIKKILKMRTEGIEQAQFKYLADKFGGKIPELKTLIPQMKQKIALIFCDASIFELKKKIQANKLPTEARVGSLSPIDFTCPAGPTGLDPSQINFFHALNISTKIVKGQIQITKDFKVCTIGKKIKASEAALLKKLNIKPFQYGMKFHGVYSDGNILPKEVLEIDPAALIVKFQAGIKNVAALSLSAGYPIQATIPLILANSFKNIAALSLESGYKVKEVDAALSATTTATVEVEAPKKQEKKKQEKKQAPKKAKEEPKQEQQEGGMGGLFD